MPYFSQKNDWSILHWDLPLSGKRIAVVSDLHMGNKKFLFQQTWQLLKQGINRKEFDAIVINGDLSDGWAFELDGGNNYLAGIIESNLKELLNLEVKVPIIITRGNHDLALPFHKMIEDLAKKYSDRVYFCDILKMPDALFVHGDFINHAPCNIGDIPYRLTDEKRLQMSIQGQCENYKRTTDKVHGRLRALLGDEFNEVKHVFVGHFHPKNPTINISKSDFSGTKMYHMTGCSKIGRLNTILDVAFDQDKVTRVSEYFRGYVRRRGASRLNEAAPLSAAR